MAERTSITQVTQIGVEATPGTAVAATKKLQAISIEPGIKAEVQSFRPMGGKFPVLAALGKEWTEASISGQAVYTDLVYLLAGVLAYAAPTQITTPDGKAYRWTFTPAQSAEDTVKTFTVEHGSAARAGRFSYGLVTQFGLKIDRGGLEVSGSMLGQRYEDNKSLSASPTAIEPIPILPTQVDVYIDDEADDLGTTKLLRVPSVEFEISDRFGPLWVLNSDNDSWVTHVETEPSATLKLLVEADAAGMALLTAMRTGTKKFVRVQATGAEIETGNDYELTLDLCGTVTEVSEFSDSDGIYAIEWTFQATYDATWKKALTVDVVNTLSAL